MINQYNSKPCLKSKNSYHKSCWTWLKNSNRWNNLQRRLFKYSAIFVYCDIGCCFHDQTEFFEGIRRKLLRKDQPENKGNIEFVLMLEFLSVSLATEAHKKSSSIQAVGIFLHGSRKL